MICLWFLCSLKFSKCHWLFMQFFVLPSQLEFVRINEKQEILLSLGFSFALRQLEVYGNSWDGRQKMLFLKEKSNLIDYIWDFFRFNIELSASYWVLWGCLLVIFSIRTFKKIKSLENGVKLDIEKEFLGNPATYSRNFNEKFEFPPLSSSLWLIFTSEQLIFF